MNDLRANAPPPVAPLLDPAPRGYYPHAPMPPRTNWGALALAFGLGAFAGFVIAAVVGVAIVYTLGRNAENTFQNVSGTMGGPNANPYFTPVAPPDRPFDHVSDHIEPKDDGFPRVGEPIQQLPIDPADPQGGDPNKDK